MLASHEAEEWLRLYLWYRAMMADAVRHQRHSLAGSLLLLSGAEQALAGRIAGGAVLVALEDPVQGRAALRAGQCDFLVHDLDEAVRILKNEVRRGAAVSVCLQRPLAEVQQAAILRGLQPDLLDAPQPVLESRGTRLLAVWNRLQPGEQLACWSASPDGSRDRAAAACLPAQDWERQRWLREAPGMLGRRRQQMRALPLLETELGCLRKKLAQAPEPCTVWISSETVAG